MIKIDTIEGTVDDVLWYRYDLASDVLYLRLASHRDVATYAEESNDGFLLLYCQDDDKVVGMTVVNWWMRFGSGALPDSLRELERQIELWAKKLAA
ncbi:MAG: DUF2283 domain-containing protein [Phycisphaerae bacterium]|nr:DUF2283 domain-containing protein [Phycisphaerae bacterium]